jgi:hypothetical protein
MSTCSRPKVAVKLVDLYADKDIYDVLIRSILMRQRNIGKGKLKARHWKN